MTHNEVLYLVITSYYCIIN